MVNELLKNDSYHYVPILSKSWKDLELVSGIQDWTINMNFCRKIHISWYYSGQIALSSLQKEKAKSVTFIIYSNI